MLDMGRIILLVFSELCIVIFCSISSESVAKNYNIYIVGEWSPKNGQKMTKKWIFAPNMLDTGPLSLHVGFLIYDGVFLYKDNAWYKFKDR